MVLITAITVYFVAAQELMMASVRSQRRFEERTKARLMLESAGAYMASELRHGLLTLPASRTLTIAGVSVNATAIDNAAAVPRTMKVTTALDFKGTAYTDSIVLGQSIDPTPWNYALFVGNSEVSAGSDVLTVGSLGAGGDTYYGFSTGGTDVHTINGDLEVAGSVGGIFSVTGTTWPNAAPIAFPTVSSVNYLAASTATNLSGTISGYAFPNLGAATTSVIYRLGDLDVEGAFTGNGVIYATGNIRLKDNITTSGGKLVLIAAGNVLLNRHNSTVSAFIYAGGTYDAIRRDNVITGALVCSGLNMTNDGAVIYDPYFWNTPSERVRFKLPGSWP